ncbi:hypothetical protein MHBO_002620, partial [Bonamia ostreae]
MTIIFVHSEKFEDKLKSDVNPSVFYIEPDIQRAKFDSRAAKKGDQSGFYSKPEKVTYYDNAEKIENAFKEHEASEYVENIENDF